MKRKDLVVGETYYRNSSKDAFYNVFGYSKDWLPEDTSKCFGKQSWIPQYGVKVLAVEPYTETYSYRNRETSYHRVTSGQGVLVEAYSFWTKDDGTRELRGTKVVVPLRELVCPFDTAVEQIKKNAVHEAKALQAMRERKAREAEYETNVYGPAIRELTTALKNLQARVDGTPKSYYRDTRLAEMPLDVIETLTAIINEALCDTKEKVSA